MSDHLPLDWMVLFSVPLIIWVAVVLFLTVLSRLGRLTYRVNALAFLGASLSLVSLQTAWQLELGGGDFTMSSDEWILLLIVYPIALVTPLASIGMLGVLLFVVSEATDWGRGLVTPYYGYVLAWISLALMLSAMFFPLGPPVGPEKPTIGHRLLTLTVGRAEDRVPANN